MKCRAAPIGRAATGAEWPRCASPLGDDKKSPGLAAGAEAVSFRRRKKIQKET
jgi:hypothetical protein